MSSKLRTYKLFKNDHYTEQYLRKNMPAYAKFRCGVAPIKIETNRYDSLSVENRLCFNDHCSLENV